MFTVVLYCWCHSDSASVLLYFTFNAAAEFFFLVYSINVHEIEMKTFRVSCDKPVERRLVLYIHFRLQTVIIPLLPLLGKKPCLSHLIS